MVLDREMEQMRKEKFHAQRAPLTFTAEPLTLTLTPGEVREGSFSVHGNEKNPVQGFVASSMPQMTCLTDTISGAADEISYRFDGSTYQVGDTAEGYFRIWSNQGEYKVPFTVNVQPVFLESSLGPVRNLFHFMNLAKTRWQEAVKIFYDPAFIHVFSASEKEEKTLYRGLSKQQGNEQNVDEFLIATGKKRAVQYLPSQSQIRHDLPIIEREPIRGMLEIGRNGWGYTRVQVEANGAFLKVDKSQLVLDDFKAGSAGIAYEIDPEALHCGWNGGAIVLKSFHETIEIPVVVTYCTSTALRTIYLRQSKKAILDMMRGYEKFRNGQESGKVFLENTKAQIVQLAESDRNNPMTALYRIHYLLTAGKSAEALWELQQCNKTLSGDLDELAPMSTAQFDLESDEEYSYRMYLTILCAEDALEGNAQNESSEEMAFSQRVGDADERRYLEQVMQDAVRAIELRHRRNPENFWIAWLYLYASGENLRRPSYGFRMMREQYQFGSRSPLLYIEAYEMVQGNPTILHEFDDFSLQVLWYAARHDLLTDAVITQIDYLAGRQKNFSFRLLHILEKCYAVKDSAFLQETLTAICTLLVRGNMTDEKYFPWYQSGVEKELPITRLYDYYMMSIPSDFAGEIPQMVLLYFVYQNALPVEKAAFLYRYVLEHRDLLGELFEHYMLQIESFTMSYLQQRQIGKDLAALYRTYLVPGKVIASEAVSAAIPVAFMCLVETTDTRLHRAVLVYDQCVGETYYPVNDGKAFVPVYGDDARIFLEDDAGNRYAVSVPFTTTRLLDYKALSETLSVYETENIPFDMYLSGMTGSYFKITEKNADRFLRLIGSAVLMPKRRNEVRRELLRYYWEQKDQAGMISCLDNINAGEDGMTRDLRNVYVAYFVRCELTMKAYEWVKHFGSEGIDADILIALCEQLLAAQPKEVLAGDIRFVDLAFESFLKGRSSEALLSFLARHMDALTEEWEKLRHAMAARGMAQSLQKDLCRRMLMQMLYTGEMIEGRDDVIATFNKKEAAPTEPNENTDSAASAEAAEKERLQTEQDQELMTRIVAQSAHYHFVRGDAMSREQFDLITWYGQEGVPIVDICRIAWLEDRADRSGEVTDSEREVAALFLSDLIAQDIAFPFFRQFIGIVPQLQAYADETLVIYRAKEYVPGTKVLYHYAMEKNGKRETYAAKEMKEMYEGVYVTGFLLFFGEQMHYYITDDAMEKHIVESGTLGQDARIPEESPDRFGEINRISMLLTLGKQEEAQRRLADYNRRAYLTDHVFG